MGLLQNLKLWIFPRRIADPDFGSLLFIHISRHPERSYWEGEWKFPKTGTPVSITLAGLENGPTLEAKQFYLSLPGRFEEILNASRPGLERVFKEWLDQRLPENIFTVVKLTGFDIEDPKKSPLRWSVSYETTDGKWLGITIPFVDATAMEAIVDS